MDANSTTVNDVTTFSSEWNNISIWELNKDKVVEDFPLIVTLGSLMLLGLVENLVVLQTYRQRRNSSSTLFFIFSLTVVDLLQCLVGTPFVLYQLSNPYTYTHTYVCKTQNYVNLSLNMTSGCLVVCLSFDRLLKVLKPGFKLSNGNSQALVISVSVCSVVVSSVVWVLNGTEKYLQHLNGTTMAAYRCSTSDLARERFPKAYLIFCSSLAIIFLFGLLILIVNYSSLVISFKNKMFRPKSASLSHTSYSPVSRRQSYSDVSNKTDDISSQQQREEEPTAKKPAGTKVFAKIDRRNLHTISTVIQSHAQSFRLTNSVHIPVDSSLVKASPRNHRYSPSARSSVQFTPPLRKNFCVNYKTCLLLVTAVVLYCMSHFTHVIVKIINSSNPSFPETLSSPFNALYNAGQNSFVLSYCFNPLVYSFMNRGFGKHCMATFRKHRTGLSRLPRHKAAHTSNDASFLQAKTTSL